MEYRRAGVPSARCGFKSADRDDLLGLMRLFAEQVVPQVADTG
jgi:hypothetical protein